MNIGTRIDKDINTVSMKLGHSMLSLFVKIF